MLQFEPVFAQTLRGTTTSHHVHRSQSANRQQHELFVVLTYHWGCTRLQCTAVGRTFSHYQWCSAKQDRIGCLLVSRSVTRPLTIICIDAQSLIDSRRRSIKLSRNTNHDLMQQEILHQMTHVVELIYEKIIRITSTTDYQHKMSGRQPVAK